MRPKDPGKSMTFCSKYRPMLLIPALAAASLSAILVGMIDPQTTRADPTSS